MLLAEFLRVLAPGIAVTGCDGVRAGAADAAVCSIGLPAKHQFELIELRHCLAGDAGGELGVSCGEARGIETLGAVHKVLILAGELRIALDLLA